MIKFFRRIRQKLLAENRFRKYLLYAIGEIILVVIGILIALQVNNWNNERLQKDKEKEYLVEIRQNLEKDSTNIARVIQFYKRKAQLVDETFGLFELAEKGEAYYHLLFPKMDTLTSFEVFIPVRTAFDNMVSAESIDLIKNKALRTLLSEYYSQLSFQSGTEERSKEATRLFTDEIAPKMMSKEMIQMYLNKNTGFPPLSEVTIHRDKQIASRLFTLYMNATILAQELELTQSKINGILTFIEPIQTE